VAMVMCPVSHTSLVPFVGTDFGLHTARGENVS
jgi:hypothetical protein